MSAKLVILLRVVHCGEVARLQAHSADLTLLVGSTHCKYEYSRWLFVFISSVTSRVNNLLSCLSPRAKHTQHTQSNCSTEEFRIQV